MPFTPSHIAAVLPLRRAGRGVLPLAALAAGSVSPDLPYYLPWLSPLGRWTHTAVGIVTVDLVLGLALWGLWRSVAPSLHEVAPAPVRERWTPADPRGARWWALLLAVAIGAAAHIAWDDFTHPGRYFATHLPVLAATYPGPFGPLHGYSWAQYASGLFGLVVLAVVAIRQPRTHAAGPARPALTVPLTVLCGAAFVAGAVVRVGQAGGTDISRNALAFAVATGGIAAAGTCLVMACWALGLVRALRSRPQPS